MVYLIVKKCIRHVHNIILVHAYYTLTEILFSNSFRVQCESCDMSCDVIVSLSYTVMPASSSVLESHAGREGVCVKDRERGREGGRERYLHM